MEKVEPVYKSKQSTLRDEPEHSSIYSDKVININDDRESTNDKNHEQQIFTNSTLPQI